MSIEQMIWRSSDHCLNQDLASYDRILAPGSLSRLQSPEMILHWEYTRDLIRRQIEIRKGYAYSASPATEVPF